MGHWVTNESGEHIYIGDGGKVLATRAAISKASGGTERGKALAGRSKAALLRAKGSKEAKPAPTGTGAGGEGPVKAGPQALRDMYAAQSRHKSLQGRLDAGDKGVTKEHVAQAREELKQSRIELLRTKLSQEKQQVAQTAAGASPQPPARAATPGVAKATGRGTPERAEVARQSKSFRSMQLYGGKAGKPANDRVREVIARERDAGRLGSSSPPASQPKPAATPAPARPSLATRLATSESKLNEHAREAMSKKNAPRTQAAGKERAQRSLDRNFKAGQKVFGISEQTKHSTLSTQHSALSTSKPAPSLRDRAATLREAHAGLASQVHLGGIPKSAPAPSLREQAAAPISPHALAGKMPIGKFAAGVNPSEIAKSYGLPHDFYNDARVTERDRGGFPSLRGEVHVSDKYDPKGDVARAVDVRESAQKRGLYEGARRKFYDQKVQEAIGAAAKRAGSSTAPIPKR